jgi:hypothetical protein
MDDAKVIAPGEHPYDPSKKEIDSIGFALERVQTHLTWIEEHRASFEKLRATDAPGAEKELRYLAHSSKEALRHFVRLTELLLAGYSFDPTKRLPKGLFQPQWLSRAKSLLEEKVEEK